MNAELTPADERQLAEDIFYGRVFTDRHDRAGLSLPTVFMALGFMDREAIDALSQTVGAGGMIYEYLSGAGPSSCNGVPMFFTFKFLATDQTDRVWRTVERMREALTAVGAEA